MAKKPDITTIASGYYSRQALNTNFENLQNGFNNTLSLDGSAPNSMSADIDLNSNDLLNARNGSFQGLVVAGTAVQPKDLEATGASVVTEQFTGDGSTKTFTLTYSPGVKDHTGVFIEGIYQKKDGYSLSGTTLTFIIAPPLNAEIEVQVFRSLIIGTTTATNVTYNQEGTGAVDTTLKAKLQESISVKDFGALGDGSTDDTASIQAALTAAAGSNNVYLPASTYIVSDTIYIPSNTFFFGDGQNSVIKMVSTQGRDTTVVMTGFRNNKRENIVIQDMEINFNRSRWTVTGGTKLTDAFSGTAGYDTYQDNNGTALSICYSENVLVKNVRAIDGYKHCIDIQAPSYRTGTDGATYDSQPSKNVTLESCYASGGGDDNITSHHSTDINITNCWSENPSGVMVPQNSNCYEIDDGSRNVFITNCVAIGGMYGLQIKGHDYAPAPYNVTVSGLRAVNNAQGVELRHSGWYSNSVSFSGDGSTTAFTLPAGYTLSPVVYIGGVKQTSGYSVSGVTLTFSSAPASGTDNIVVYKSDSGEDPEIVDEEGNVIAYTGTSPTARNVMLSDISIIAPREKVHPTVTGSNIPAQVTYGAKYGMRIRSYENVQLVNVSFNDSTLDLAGDYEAATAMYGDTVCRIYSGASNVIIQNMSIYGFGAGTLEMEKGLSTTNSFVGPIYVDGFISSNGPEHPIRMSSGESVYEGTVNNFIISGSQADKAAVLVTCPNVQVGSGTVTGYDVPVSGAGGATEESQPKGFTLSRAARSSGGTTTTPVSAVNLDWYEPDGQNLGAGEGLKQSWRTKLQADSTPIEVGYVGFIKSGATDAERMHDFVIANSADGGDTAATPKFEVAPDGTTRPSGNGTQKLGDSSHKWSEVFASNGTINTSDERQKQDIADIDAAESRVALVLKGKLKKFKWKDAVSAKGENARIHIGIMAQEVQAAFAAESLDANDYSMFCYDQWTTGSEETGDLETHDSYGVRYTELLAFIISAM